MDSSLDLWIERKPMERKITLLVTVGSFELPKPDGETVE